MWYVFVLGKREREREPYSCANYKKSGEQKGHSFQSHRTREKGSYENWKASNSNVASRPNHLWQKQSLNCVPASPEDQTHAMAQSQEIGIFHFFSIQQKLLELILSPNSRAQGQCLLNQYIYFSSKCVYRNKIQNDASHSQQNRPFFRPHN